MSQQETTAIRDQLRRLIDNTPNEADRARILLVMVQACYDATKFTFPAGGGLDGRDGPERDEIAAIVDQAHGHLNHARERQTSLGEARRGPVH